MKYNYIQHGFTSGELSPRLEMREDLEGRRYGVSLMENFYPRIQGSACTFPGFKYLGSIPESYGRIFPFYISADNRRIVVITPSYLYIYSLSGELEYSEYHDGAWDEEELKNMQVASPSQDSVMYIVSPTTIPSKLVYNKTTTNWSLSNVFFTNMPSEWGIGNYPSTVEFYAGRLYYASTLNQPTQIWGSKPVTGDSDKANYDNFTMGDLADDAVSFIIAKTGKIRWLQGTKDFIIGTEEAEYRVTSEGGVIIPGDIQVKIQTTNGSTIHQSLIVDNEVLFISSDGRKIYSINYEWQQESWVARNITFGAEHLTSNDRFLRIVNAKNPLHLFFAVTENKDLIGALYDSKSKITGFFRKTVEGTCNFIDIASVLNYGTSELWALVDRGIGTGLRLEKINFQYDTTKLDSYETITSATETDTFTVSSLKGVECQVLVDGVPQDKVTPDATTGEFTTNDKGTYCQIGIPITSSILTMPTAADIPSIGTVRPLRKKWVSLYVRINASYMPLINGSRPPTRHSSTAMGLMEAPQTKNVKVANLGWDEEGRVFIQQDLPLPTEILGLFGEIVQI